MKKRLIALLLCLVMLVTCMGVGVFLPPDIKLLDAGSGEAVASVSVPQSDRVKLTTDYKSSGEPGYQWQLSADGKTWINIYGQTGESVQLSYAMVCNMLNGEGTVQVRCMVTDGESEYASRAAEVSVDYSAPARPAQAAKAPASVAPVSVAPVSDPAPASEGETQGTKTIIINYVFQNGEQAANPWTATVAKGSDYTQTVNSPAVVGYAPDQETVEVNVTNIQDDETYTVTYKPAEVEYTVNHYQQNIDNDNYTLVSTETKKGFTESPVGENLRKSYEGFTALLYDTTTKIAADGSTVVEIKYDRYYYLLNFNLNGGWGVEPIYARYGTPISIDTSALTKTGYRFGGWAEGELPATMPAEDKTFTAKWDVDGTAKVTVAFWGENAAGDGYDFLQSTEIQKNPGESVTYKEGVLTCNKEEHTHSAACVKCGHGDKHTLACYGLSDRTSDNPDYYGANDAKGKFEENEYFKNGVVCRYLDGHRNSSKNVNYYFIYLNGQYYKLTESEYNSLKTNVGGEKHDFGDLYDRYYVYESKRTCGHPDTHIDSCYTCGKEEHTHNADCYYTVSGIDSKLWKFDHSDTVTVKADGSTVLNVYYDRTKFTLTFMNEKTTVKTITAKWGADIHNNFPIKDGNKTIWWDVPKNCQSFEYDTQLGSIDTMPAENIRFTKSSADYGAVLWYYVETLNGETGTYTHDGKNFNVYKKIDITKSGYLTYTEEFHNIIGFTQWWSDPKFNKMEKGGRTSGINDNNYLCYTRNSYELSFYNYDRDLTDETKTVQYQASLNSYYFEPEYPSALEAGAYKFDGWYTTARCYAESKVNFDTQTMPAADVKLFAKWVPVTHTVTTYLTKDAVNGGTHLGTWSVQHGAVVENPPEAPENAQRTFVGWFYEENGVEKAFDFSMQVRKDLVLYAKWRSDVMVDYTIKYELKDGTEIAPPTTGKALAETTKTFEAKTGAELNTGYQSGYFPETNSHSIKFDIDNSANNEYTFVYVPKEEVNYTVRYLEKGTGNELIKPKTVKTRDAVVTEKFEQVTGYAPDAYQKRLVLSANEEENVITFWYTQDTVHAPVQVIHWIQNIAGNEYTEYQSSVNLNGEIGKEYSEAPLTIKGFQYNAVKSNASGELTAAGLVLNLYYDRIEYPYEFRFLEQGTDKELKPPVIGNARYQAQVTQKATAIPGYTLASAENQAINIAIEDPADVASKNVRTFYYTENTATINYVVVGPEGCGSVTPGSETVKVLTGEAQGSTAAVSNDTYKFVGWYSDEGCTVPVNTSWVDAENKLTPGKTETYGSVQGYKSTTYYAKFDYNVVDLTITKTISGKDSKDLYGERSFVFHVKGTDENPERIDIDVVVKIKNGETSGSVVLKALPIGSYTITEDTGWSWRYECNGVGFTGVSNHSNTGAAASCTLVGGKDNVVTFTNSWLHAQWLSFTTSVQNIFGNK